VTTIHAEITVGRESIILVAGGLGMPEDVAQAAKRLKALTPLFSKSDPPGALTVPATWAAVVQLAATFGDHWAPGPRLAAWTAEQAAVRMNLPPLGFRAPKGLALRPYQADGARLIAATGRALITDEPRTGKTITTIAGLIDYTSARLLPGPALVVCPASVVDPWVEEWETWAPHVKAVAWRGPAARRHALAGSADVYVTSYDVARIDSAQIGRKAPLRDLLADLKGSALVVDECHYIKNNQAARSKAVRKLAEIVVGNGGAVVGLSGTPITRDSSDLWPMLYCLEPGAYPAKGRWVDRYCEQIQGDYDTEVIGLNRFTEAEFRLSLLGQHRRVARADVMADLPPKVYSIRTVELPAHWRKAYDAFEATMIADLPDDGGELAVMDAMSVLTHLSALSSAPADVEVTYGPDVDERTGEPKRHVHLDLKGPSWKVAALLEILEERPGEKVVVFAESAQIIRLAGTAAEAAGLPGFEQAGYIIGGQSQRERTATRAAFQSGDLNLVCATTGAGGTGITLSAAGTLVFLQRPWKLVESIQAEDRAEGDLQASRGTEIIDVVARNTVDSRRRAVLRERAGQLAELVQDPRIVRELLGGSNVIHHSREKAS